jgi:hypothetical protein
MTTMTTTSTHTSTRTAASSAGVAAVGVGGVLTALFAHDWIEIGVSVGLLIAVAIGVFGYVVPRALRKESAGGTALGLAIPAFLLTLPAFWSGLPLVLGVAGLIVGNAGRSARSGSGKCIAAVVLSSLAVLGYLAIYVFSAFAGETGFLLD